MIVTASLLLSHLTSEVSKDSLRQTLTHLSTYPTRNTNTPELEKAAEWVASEFKKIPGLRVELMRYDVKKGRRVVADKSVVQVVATLPGESDKKVIVGGHLDTINLTGDPLTAIAPGINDDGSGVALTLECARILSQKRWRNTLVFVAFSGEEQGLFGSGALAERAQKESWKIEAMLNNDTVGASQGPGKLKDKKRVRLYSEESTDHNSRELARFIEWETRGKVKGFSPWLVFRKDRFQRGGDHTPFNIKGFNAVRFVEAIEYLTHQHTDKDTLEGIDFDYLANVVRLNLISLSSFASAADAPTNVRYDAKQAHDTIVRWNSQPGVSYRVYWRESSSSVWQGMVEAGEKNEVTIKGKNKDDHVFAVGAVGGVPISAG
ncbi:MAG: M20/M25/M40 family metallo-hydrolase [Fimbriimonas sp.]